MDHSIFGDLSSAGVAGVWGDITSPDILHAARIEDAQLLLLSMPDPKTIQLCVERARRMNPNIVVIARAVREHHVAELGRMGVNAVVQPEFEGGVEMVRQALVRYGCDDATTARLVSEARGQFYGNAGGHELPDDENRADGTASDADLQRPGPIFRELTVPYNGETPRG